MIDLDKIIANYNQINNFTKEITKKESEIREAFTKNVQHLLYEIKEINKCKIHISHTSGYFYEINGQITRINFAFLFSINESLKENEVKALLLNNNIKESSFIDFDRSYHEMRKLIVKESQAPFNINTTFLYDKNNKDTVTHIQEPKSHSRVARGGLEFEDE